MTRAALIVLTGLILAVPASVPAATLTVPTDHPTITAAVTAASAADVIVILAGTYPEVVTVGPGKNGLQILGASRTKVIIDAGGLGGIGLRVQSGDVVVSGLTVRHADDEGIRCETPPAGTKTCQLLSVGAVNNKKDGVRVNGPDALVTDSFFTGNTDAGLKVTDGANARILDNDSNNNNGRGYDLAGDAMTVDSNKVNLAGDVGLFVTGDGNVVSKNGIVLADGTGLQVTGDGNLVRANSVSQANGDCLDVNGDSVVVERNRAESCKSIGIKTVGANGRIEGNAVTGVDTGEAYDLKCQNSCGAFQVLSNKATGAVNSHGFLINVTAGPGGWLVQRNQASRNGVHGFDITGVEGIIRANKADTNGTGLGHGFRIKGTQLTVLANHGRRNSGDGFNLVKNDTTDSNVVEKNKADGNQLDGIHVGSNVAGTQLTRNSALRNLGDGLRNDGIGTVAVKNKATDNRVDCSNAASATITSTDDKCQDGSNFAVLPSDLTH
jgi:hypothetical protein